MSMRQGAAYRYDVDAEEAQDLDTLTSRLDVLNTLNRDGSSDGA